MGETHILETSLRVCLPWIRWLWIRFIDTAPRCGSPDLVRRGWVVGGLLHRRANLRVTKSQCPPHVLWHDADIYLKNKMNKKEKTILQYIDAAFAANILAHKKYDESSSYWSLSHSDLDTLWRTEYRDHYLDKAIALDRAIDLLLKYKKNKIRRWCSSDRKILYIQYGIKQASFHRGGWWKWLTPFFRGSWKKKINIAEFRFLTP